MAYCLYHNMTNNYCRINRENNRIPHRTF